MSMFQLGVHGGQGRRHMQMPPLWMRRSEKTVALLVGDVECLVVQLPECLHMLIGYSVRCVPLPQRAIRVGLVKVKVERLVACEGETERDVARPRRARMEERGVARR